MLPFIKKVKNRFKEMNISEEKIFLIYDEESDLSKIIWKDLIDNFEKIEFLKIDTSRIWDLPNKSELDFFNKISWACFLIFSDKWLDFKNYLWWKKLRDYLISNDIATFEIWRLKYFNTEKLQKDLLYSLEELISKEVEEKWLLFEEKFSKTKKVSINNELFYEWDFEDLKYNFWLYKWQKNTLKWSLYPVWEVLLN